MTKLKPPLTEGDALDRISTFLDGRANAASIAGRSASHLAKWANPDMEDSTPLAIVVKLERAYRAAGGIGSPLLEYALAQVELGAAEAIAEDIEVHRLAVDINRAAGEANAELAELTLPGVTDNDFVEAEQASKRLYQKLSTLLPALQRAIARRRPHQQPP